MIYQSNHQTPTMSSTRKTSPRLQHRKLQSTASKSSTSSSRVKRDSEKPIDRCRGRCRVQWSEKHVKEGLVLVQEAQLARVVKTGPISEHYEIDAKPFASGQWARVYRCRSRSTGTLYAAKYSSRNRFNTDCSAELRHEIALLSLCSQSPRVVRLHDVYETPKEIILVMEYAPGGDLQTLIDGDLVPLEGDVVHFVKQLVEGLAYLHERNIAHLDIKPQNLVMMGSFPESEVKLCDFEISRVILEGTEVREILGTPDYVAPEILHYEPITLAADMWSLGITTYVLLTGFSPFGGETDQETFQNISLGEVDFPEELFEDVSSQAKDFVAKLLVLDPSARMSAKQCLRHDWLRDAPTQASPHLRRYLSKSREVLLERVVSRENLRRAALLSQATSHANLLESEMTKNLGGSLSQSDMCLSNRLTGSRGSLTGSDCYISPAGSRTSLNSSQTSLATSQASLATSQNYLLNKEQTQGLLNQAQSRSQANLNRVTRRGLLSRMRSLNQIQSQACLSQVGETTLKNNEMDGFFGSRSQEKLYGLRCLSKSQGVLDIYRSLECLRKKKKRKKDQRAMTEDILPIYKKIGHEIASGSCGESSNDASQSNARVDVDAQDGGRTREMAADDRERCARLCANDATHLSNEKKIEECPKHIQYSTKQLNHDNDESVTNENVVDNVVETKISHDSNETQLENREESQSRKFESEENLDSLQSVESDTLTEDSDETPLDRTLLIVKKPSHRQHSDISSHSNNSANSDDKDEHSESENDEPKYTVAQLVSAFNKHQEVASKTSLEAIMTEKRVNEVTFPTGPKALRLFIPDINITERGVVRRKTSYKPRKNWEELRKQNEKNEAVLKDFDNDSGNEDVDRENEIIDKSDSIDIAKESNDSEIVKLSTIEITFKDDDENFSWQNCENGVSNKETDVNEETLDTRIDVKYKQCVDGTKIHRTAHDEKNKMASQRKSIDNEIILSCRQIEQPEVTTPTKFVKTKKFDCQSIGESKIDSTVNLKDILEKMDAGQRASKENLEKLRKRTSITKIILNDNMAIDNDSNNNNGTNGVINRAKSEPPSITISTRETEQTKLNVPPSFVRSSSLSSESSCPTPSSVQSDIGMSWEDVHGNRGSSPFLEKDDAKLFVKRGTNWDSVAKTESQNSNDNRFDENRTKTTTSTTTAMTPEERRLWGKVCTGSYTRAMEKFSGKPNSDMSKRSNANLLNSSIDLEKTRRKSSPAMPQYGDS